MLMYRAKNERRISIHSLFTLWVKKKKKPTFFASQMKILVGLTCFHLFIPDLLIILEVFIVSFRLTLGKKSICSENQFGLVLFCFNWNRTKRSLPFLS